MCCQRRSRVTLAAGCTTHPVVAMIPTYRNEMGPVPLRRNRPRAVATTAKDIRTTDGNYTSWPHTSHQSTVRCCWTARSRTSSSTPVGSAARPRPLSFHGRAVTVPWCGRHAPTCRRVMPSTCSPRAPKSASTSCGTWMTCRLWPSSKARSRGTRGSATHPLTWPCTRWPAAGGGGTQISLWLTGVTSTWYSMQICLAILMYMPLRNPSPRN